MSNNSRSPRNRIPESFRVERLESRVMLSADPVLTPIAMAMLPHAAHVPAAPHATTGDAGLMKAGQSVVVAQAMFDAQSLSTHAAVLLPVQPAATHDAQAVTVPAATHATTTFTSAQTASSAASSVMTIAAVAPASTSLATAAGRMHILSAPPGSNTTWTTDQTSASITTAGSIGLNAASGTILATATTSVSLGTSGSWIYGVTQGQSLSIVRGGSTAIPVTISDALPSYVSSGQFALKNLTIGAQGAAVGNVHFADAVNLTGNLTIYATGSVTFDSSITLTNNASLTIVGASSVSFGGAVHLTNLDGNDAGGTATVSGAAGSIKIQADSVSFPAGTSTFTGSGTLTILPATVGRGISFANPTGVPTNGTLIIDNTAIGSWGSTFSGISIGNGHADGFTGAINIGGTQNFGVAGSPTVLDTISFFGSSISVVTAPPATTGYTFYGLGNVNFDATGNISLNNEVIANGGASDVSMTSSGGNINVNLPTSGTYAGVDISAHNLTASAAGGIALPSVQVANLTATNTNTGAVNNGGSINITQNATGGALNVLQATNAAPAGDIFLTTAAGSMTIASALSGGSGVAASGSGNVGLTVQGSGNTLTVSDTVAAGTGNVIMTAPGLVTLGAQTSTTGGGVSVSSTANGIQVNANVLAAGGLLQMSSLNDIAMTAGTTLSSLNGGNTGAISLNAGGNDVLATLSAGGTMSVTAGNAITSAMLESTSAAQLNLVGATAKATLTSARGIGARNADIQTSIQELTLTNSVSGDVYVNQTQTGALQLGVAGGANALTLGGTTGTASVVTTDGGITLNTAVVDTATGGTAGQTGHLLLQASKAAAASADIALDAGISTTTGSIEIKANNGSIAVGNASTPNTPITIAANAAGQTAWLQAAGNVTFNATSQLNAGGNVWISATGGSVTLGQVTSTGGIVAIDAGNTIVDAQSNGSQTAANVTAANVRLASASGVGTASNSVVVSGVSGGGVTFAGTSTGASTTGGIFLLSQSALTVGSVAATPVAVIGAAATPTTTGDAAALNSVAVSGASNMVLRSQGALTVASAIGLAGPVSISSVTYSTNLRLDAAGALQVNAAIGNIGSPFTTYTGNMSLFGGSVGIGAGLKIDTLAGTLDVESTSGDLLMGNGSRLATSSGAIRVRAAGNLAVGRVTSTSGSVALTAAGGSITDANGNTTGSSGTANVQAASLRLAAAANIGSSTDELQVNAPTLSAAASAGSVYVIDAAATTVGSVAVTVNQVGTNGSTTPVTDATQSGVTTGGANGNIVLQDAGGAFVVSSAVTANGSGNVLLQAQSGSVTLNANVGSTTGSISVLGSSGVNVGSGGTAQNITTGGSGSIDVESAGSVAMVGNSLLGAGSGTVHVVGSGIQLARVSTTGNASLTATGGAIADANGNTDAAAGIVNVTAAGLRLNAFGAIGTSTDALQTQVGSVSAASGTGSIWLLDGQSVSVGSVAASYSLVGADGGLSALADTAQQGLATAVNGHIVLQATAGDLTVNNLVNANGGSAGNGNVLLQAVAGTLTLAANVDSSASGTGNGVGSISLWGQSGVVFDAGVSAQTGSGTVDVESGAGSVLMGAGSLAASGSGSVGVQAAHSVALGTVQTNGGAAVTALAGSITDANGNANGVSGGTENVIAQAARLSATNAIGSGTDALRTQAGDVAAAGGAGGVFLMSDQTENVSHVGVTVNQVGQTGAVASTLLKATLNGVATTGGGNVVLDATAGNIALNSTSSALPAVTATGGGNILVKSEAGSVSVTASVYSNGSSTGNGSGSITVQGATGVGLSLVGGNATLGTGTGTIDVESSGGSITMGANALVSDTSGAVRLAAGAGVAVGRIVSGANVALSAAGGSITDADGNLTANPGGTIDVQAAGLLMTASAGAGTGADALRTHVGTLDAVAGTAGLYAINDQALVVGPVDVVVRQVDLAGSSAGSVEISGQALHAGGSGNIVLATTAGDLTLADPGNVVVTAGSGNVLLQAAGSLHVNSEVDDASGNVTLLGAQGVAIASNTNVQAGASVDVESSAGSVSLGGTGLLHSDSADVRVVAAQDIGLGLISTPRDISLTATAGSITDTRGLNNQTAGSNWAISGDGLRLYAGSGLGTTSLSLQTHVNTISENTGAGGGYVANHDALVVGSVSASVAKVGLDGNTGTVNDAAQAGLVSRANGNLVLWNVLGDLTLTSASPSVAAVDANGSGNVSLYADGLLRVDANVYSGGGSGSGSIKVFGVYGVDIGTSGTVATVGTGAGTVDVISDADVVMSAHSVIASGGADVRVQAQASLVVGEIESGGNVALQTAGGAVTDANGNTTGGSGNVLNVVAQGLQIEAATGAGTSADALQVHVATLGAAVGSAGLFLVDDESFAIAGVSATLQEVGQDGGLTPDTAATIAGVTAGSGGDVVLSASAGDITVDTAIHAAGTANVLVRSASGSVALAADVRIADAGTGAGDIALFGAAGVTVAANVGIVDATGGASSVDIESSNGSVQMGAGSTIDARAVRVVAAQDIGLAQVVSTGNVALVATAGTISNATAASNNVTASGLYLSAGTAAGTAGAALDTHVATLSAAVGNGGMHVVNDQGFSTGSVSTTANTVGLDGNASGFTTSTASDAIASSGAVTLEATAGDIDLASANASVAAINANGTGSVLVESDTGSIGVDANVLDGSGNTPGGISLLASRSVTIGAGRAVGIVDGAGAMDIEAFAGDIAMGTASALQASVGTVRVVAEGGVTLGVVQATGDTLVQAATGALAVNANVTAGAGTQAGTLTLHGAGDVTVAAGVTVSDGAGAVAITSDLGNVSLDTSSLLQSASGAIRVVAAQSVAAGTVQTNGDTLLQAQGGTLQLNDDVRAGSGTQAGTLSLLATGDVVGAWGITLSDGAGRVDVESSGGNVTMGPTTVLQSDGGSVNVSAARGVTLGSVLADANTRVQAHGGDVVLWGAQRTGTGSSGGSLSVLASGTIFTAVGDVVSSGAGSLDLEAGGSVELDASSSLQSVSGAVRVVSAGGIDVSQISTGGSVALTAGGNIFDATVGARVDVIADGVRLVAGNGIGSTSAPFEIQADTVTASAGAGGVLLQSTQGVTVGSVAVTANQVAADGSASTVTDAAQAGIATSSDGNVSLKAVAGDITLTPAGGNAISANGSGSVLVQALAAGGDVDAFAGITSGTGNIDVIAGHDVVLYTPGSAAAQISTALPGLVNVHAINGQVISGGVTVPGQTVNLDSNQLFLDAPLVGTNNQLNIGPSIVASNPAPVVVGGTAAGGSGALYLSQDQIGLIQAGFQDVDIGSTIPGQAVNLVGQDASGNASANVFVNPLTLTASGAGGTVSISGGLQASSLDVEGSRTGTTLASAAVSTRGAIVVNDDVVVTGATSITSGTGGAAGLTVNGTITGSGANSLAMSANGGDIVVTGAVSGLGALNVTQAASLTFQSTLQVSGNVVINATGVVDFAGGVTIAAGGSLTIVGASQVTFAAGADFTHAGNVKIATNVLNLDGGAGSIRGAGTLTLQAATAGGAIHLGSGTVSGALDIGAQTISAIAPGFQQVVIGTVDTASGHAAAASGAVDIQGSTSLTAFAAPTAIYASTIAVDAGGTGVHVGGALTLDAVGQISLGSDVTTTVAANVSLTSATSTISQAAQAKLGSLGGNVTVTTGNSSNATLSVIDTRATGSDVGASVNINVQGGRVIDANADATVNVYAAAVTMQGYGVTNAAGASPNSVIKVRAPVVYVAPPTGTVVADAGQDGRTNYNALDHGTMYEELIAVGATTRVTLPGDAVLGAGPEGLASQGVTALDVSLIHAATIESFLNRLFAPAPAAADADGVSLSLATDAGDAPSGYVLGSQSSQPAVSGIESYGEGSVDWWTETLAA